MAQIEVAQKLRPCIIRGRDGRLKKGRFHVWEQIAEPRDAILRGEVGGQYMQMFGLVELEDGSIVRAEATRIKFTDGRKKRYSLEEGDDDV